MTSFSHDTLQSRDISKTPSDCTIDDACEIDEGRLYFTCLPDGYEARNDDRRVFCDTNYTYQHFFADFGPLHLGHVHAFCTKLRQMLKDEEYLGRPVYVWSSHHPHRRANAVVLVIAFEVLCSGRTAEEAYAPFAGIYPPLVSFRDAAFGICTYQLDVLDCARAIERAYTLDHINMSTFDAEQYMFFDKIEHGDINWIIPGKFLAFSGPLSQRREVEPGKKTLLAEDYVPIFRRLGVTCVIRFNKKCYDRRRFTEGGIKHHDLFYEDGGNPTEDIWKRFLCICEETQTDGVKYRTVPRQKPTIMTDGMYASSRHFVCWPNSMAETDGYIPMGQRLRWQGGIAVHCKAGLGRTGTNIALYMMKHYGYGAAESIALCRICRPGCIVGPQQQFLHELEARMKKEGGIYRKAFLHRGRGTDGAHEEQSVQRNIPPGGVLAPKARHGANREGEEAAAPHLSIRRPNTSPHLLRHRQGGTASRRGQRVSGDSTTSEAMAARTMKHVDGHWMSGDGGAGIRTGGREHRRGSSHGAFGAAVVGYRSSTQGIRQLHHRRASTPGPRQERRTNEVAIRPGFIITPRRQSGVAGPNYDVDSNDENNVPSQTRDAKERASSLPGQPTPLTSTASPSYGITLESTAACFGAMPDDGDSYHQRSGLGKGPCGFSVNSNNEILVRRGVNGVKREVDRHQSRRVAEGPRGRRVEDRLSKAWRAHAKGSRREDVLEPRRGYT